MGKRKMTNNEKAGLLAIVGGILMLLAGVTGAAAWSAVGDLVVDITGTNGLRLPFQVLAFFGSLGGVIVILGGIFIHGKYLKMKKDNRLNLGKLFITIGAGMGVIGLMIFLVLALFSSDTEGNILGAVGLGFVGLILTIAARMRCK